jgi:hypothetical protein
MNKVLVVFEAVVARSTDSDHDGILSRFKLQCELTPDAARTGQDSLA